MNHIYKTIWNKTKNAFDVVAENVSSKGKKTSGSKSGAETGFGQVSHFLAVLTPLAAMLFVQSSLAEVIVGDTNTQVHNANNGVQIIDIATANAAGISHNRYVSYNVDKTGQILNNAAQSASQLSVMTELAGKIMTNANLNTSA
ncbi:MAG: ESPR-type extended signal peptide-containing protein, partial [Acinetobacter sp.]